MDDVNGSDAQSGLDGLLAEAQYEVTTTELNPGSGDNNESTEAPHEGLSPESSNSAEQPPAENPTESQTTPPEEVPAAGTQNNEGPVVDPEVERIRAENAQLVAYRQNIERQQAMQREQQFQAQLAEMTPEERTIALQARQIQNLRNQQMQIQNESQQAETQRQEMAKQTLAAVMISEYGLPPFAQGELLRATGPEQMEQIAQQVKQQFESGYTRLNAQPAAPQPAAPQPPQYEPGIDPYAAGGAAAGTMQIEKPEIGSGDLDALLNASQYEVKRQF